MVARWRRCYYSRYLGLAAAAAAAAVVAVARAGAAI